jgi:hypothetical protein
MSTMFCDFFEHKVPSSRKTAYKMYDAPEEINHFRSR